MTDPLADVPAVTPGGVRLTPSQRLILKNHGVLAIAREDGGTLIVWLDAQGNLSGQYYPAEREAALACWREQHAGPGPEADNGLSL